MHGSCRGVAQPGSALAWGARGREFESRRPDQENQALRPIFGLAFLLSKPPGERLGEHFGIALFSLLRGVGLVE